MAPDAAGRSEKDAPSGALFRREDRAPTFDRVGIREGCVMSRFLVTLGVVLILAGLLWPLLQRLGLGRLPGDIVIERENFRLYIPLATSLLVSAVVSLVLWLLGR
jgi:hypothetical protein